MGDELADIKTLGFKELIQSNGIKKWAKFKSCAFGVAGTTRPEGSGSGELVTINVK